jgi:hypothetical protein
MDEALAGQSDLTLAAYNEAEARAKAALSADHVRAFAPTTFRLHGYPEAAESDAAVLRYVDTMQEFNDPLRFHEKELYTVDEAALVRNVCERVVELTRVRFGRPVRPWQGPLTTMKMFRAIQELARVSGLPKLRIFEIGPGSGHLGGLLISAGHMYYSSDIAQGFYLWQSQFCRALAGTEFVEGGLQQQYPYPGTARVVHMPWWHYATLYRASALPAVDLVVCDHALGEMHAYAMRYTTQLAQEMLASSPLGMVVFESIGEPRFHSEEAVRLNFARVGLDTQIAEGPIKAIGTAARMQGAVAKALKSSPPPFSPSGDQRRLLGREIIPIRANEAPLSYELYRYMGYDTPRPTG